jgi:hypothetical protein
VTIIAGQVSNYNAISHLTGFQLTDFKVWSGNHSQNQELNSPVFVRLGVILEIKNTVFGA